MTSVFLSEMAFRPIQLPSNSPCLRPSSWPPSRDWPVCIAEDGAVVSRWGDSVWDFSSLLKTRCKINFHDAKIRDPEDTRRRNADYFRLIMTWRIWGHKAVRNASSIISVSVPLAIIVKLCNRYKIYISDLYRYPKVINELKKNTSKSMLLSMQLELHRIYDARQSIGFYILDPVSLERLSSGIEKDTTVQTPYIPPRIWIYQVTRLRECLLDFLEHREQLSACFHFCLNAYITNYGSLQAALSTRETRKANRLAPFSPDSAQCKGGKYFGQFSHVAEQFGIRPLLERWVITPRTGWTIRMFTAYMNLVVTAGSAYIANFTLQRANEMASLRIDCLHWENDEKLGRVPIICGETTKTVADSDARWVTSPSIEVAIEAMTIIARLRMKCDYANPAVAPSLLDQINPYLNSRPAEPWSHNAPVKYDIRNPITALARSIQVNPKLFDANEMRITSEDLNIALRLTPNLPKEKFAVGKIWPINYHQYRRTGAVNMFASGDVSRSSMQQLLKHSSRLMPLYYGRGYTRLQLNGEVERMLVTAMYDATANKFRDIASDRFVSPYSDQHKDLRIEPINTTDVKTLVKLVKEGKVSFREHRLGGCMKAGACEYGGIESIERCTGVQDKKPCSDVLFDRLKEPQIRAQFYARKEEMSRLPKESPRYRALELDCKGMEAYLNVVTKD